MVQETRAGVPIGVLNDNMQELQQQIDDHSNAIGLINTRFDRMEASFANLQTLMVERLPKQPKVVQPAAQPR